MIILFSLEDCEENININSERIASTGSLFVKKKNKKKKEKKKYRAGRTINLFIYLFVIYFIVDNL